MFPQSICEIKFWGNWNYEFLQLKTFMVLAWFTTFELAVVLMSTSENLYSTRGVARIFSEVRTILQITLHPHPPPQKKRKKTFLDLRFDCVVSLTVFFCIWNDISNLWNILSGVWVHLLMHVNHLSYSLCRGGSVHRLLSCNKAPYFSGFVTRRF